MSSCAHVIKDGVIKNKAGLSDRIKKIFFYLMIDIGRVAVGRLVIQSHMYRECSCRSSAPRWQLLLHQLMVVLLDGVFQMVMGVADEIVAYQYGGRRLGLPLYGIVDRQVNLQLHL